MGPIAGYLAWPIYLWRKVICAFRFARCAFARLRSETWQTEESGIWTLCILQARDERVLAAPAAVPADFRGGDLSFRSGGCWDERNCLLKNCWKAGMSSLSSVTCRCWPGLVRIHKSVHVLRLVFLK